MSSEDTISPTALIQHWRGVPETLSFIRDNENSVWRFKDRDANNRILRITDDTHRSSQAISAELAFINYLSDGGLSVARPIAAIDGSFAQSYGSNEQTFHACAFEAQDGQSFKFSAEELNDSLFTKWGSFMGKLHDLSKCYDPPSRFKRHEWNEDKIASCNLANLPCSENEAAEEHAHIFGWIDSHPKTNQNYGLIHGDFERTNFVIQGNELHLFDFDDCCYHWFVMDIASALWAFRDGPRNERNQFLNWFLQGYCQHYELPSNFIADFSMFIRLKTLNLFIHHLSQPAESRPKAEWFRKVRESMTTPYVW